MTDFAALLRALAGGGVRFIIIGGAAATAHGSTRLTADLDVVYDRSEDNIDRLAAARPKDLGRWRSWRRSSPHGTRRRTTPTPAGERHRRAVRAMPA